MLVGMVPANWPAPSQKHDAEVFHLLDFRVLCWCRTKARMGSTNISRQLACTGSSSRADTPLRTLVPCCLSLVGCAAIHLWVGFLREHGHRPFVVQKLVSFDGTRSVTLSGL